MQKHLFSLLTAGTLIVSASATLADEEMTVSVKRMTMETAIAIAQGAVVECRKQGVQATATVVDRNGTVQAVARDTLAPPVSIDISRNKAYTAANFSASTANLGRLAGSPVGRQPGLVMSAGGLLVEAGGYIYGAVGVSGAPSGETDEACARAGINMVSDDLEMAD